MNISKDYAVQMQGIVKRFGNFTALNNMELNVKKGTIHAILGENGAGKSTLMNILYGLYQADDGKIYINGEEVAMKNPNVAISSGIGMVHQHFMLVENFTVAQNIILGNEVTKGLGVLDMDKAKEKINEMVEKYGLEVDPDAVIEDISVGMQQRVEILKALYRGADILILDEPTAVLTPQEIEDLIQIMHNLIEDGKTIIIITHKLKEIKESSDVCSIVRRGQYIDTVKVEDVTEEELANMMVGHAVKLVVDKKEANPKDVVFEIKDLVVENERKLEAVKNLSLKVRRGEIVGIAGIDGNGQKELIEAVTCLTKVKKGTIKMNGVEIQNTTPKNVINHKIATIHEDRQKRGLVLNFTVAENAVIENYKKAEFSKRGFLRRDQILKHTKNLIKEYDVRPDNCEEQLVRGLSGGNQQKVIIAREIANQPDLLIAVQPTRGLDVGAIEYVHKMLVKERDAGKAVLLISLELDEVMNVSDRIAVIYDGHIAGEFKQGEVDEQTIGLLMAGGNENGKTE
ncbi:nucleoside ABC transporter ATP-binding protein [[Clostridium] polysaccharolyticum]|uniref:Nucleoside ABC transporter ATP-binding protein n=2 Tax=[Clostridium] polysaccharolyticum TaxID=29364 RepID=A0A1I0BS72_9FIRM|nr:ABC transporter ATP-binding protein [[Clostridium] polysaccharolyticum]SET09908.1 nucleoside ABC transporter ATP-binding protein [[Clostridium] polysaccharolyticum]